MSASQKDSLGVEQHTETSNPTRRAGESLEEQATAGNRGPGAVDVVEIILGQKEAAKLKKVPLGSGASSGLKRRAEGLGRGRAAPPRFHEGTVLSAVLPSSV